jgi:hypothetical protein
VIQVVGNHVQDTFAEHAHQTLIILKIVRLRTKDPPVENGSGTVEVDMALLRRLDVSVGL